MFVTDIFDLALVSPILTSPNCKYLYLFKCLACVASDMDTKVFLVSKHVDIMKTNAGNGLRKDQDSIEPL